MVGLATLNTIEVEAPPLPRWYVEAPIEDSESGRLMDEVRTALLDYPNPEHIEELKYGCVCICLASEDVFPLVSRHLCRKGFKLLDENGYIAHSGSTPMSFAYESVFVAMRRK